VGTTLDYAPFSFREGGDPQGFDVDLVRRFAADQGLPLTLVPVTWPGLVPGLVGGAYDVALGGVTVRPDRSLAGRFTAPVAESGAVVLVPAASPLRAESDLERQGLRLAVNAGGHLETVARARFPAADIHALSDNTAVPEELVRGTADAVLTDSVEALRWQHALPPTRALGPLTRDRKAWLVASGERELARTLDAWLLAREADGSLAAERERWLGGGAAAPTATPLAVLVAAIDERLSLMPWVAEAKARRSQPVTDAAQEARVLEAGRGAVAAAAVREGRPAPSPASVDALFSSLIVAATEVERARLDAGPAPAVDGPDLDGALRPAIARSSERVAEALVALDAPVDAGTARAATQDGVRSVALSPTTLDRIADAIAACARGAVP